MWEEEIKLTRRRTTGHWIVYTDEESGDDLPDVNICGNLTSEPPASLE